MLLERQWQTPGRLSALGVTALALVMAQGRCSRHWLPTVPACANQAAETGHQSARQCSDRRPDHGGPHLVEPGSKLLWIQALRLLAVLRRSASLSSH